MSSGIGLTITPTGKIAGGSVTDSGVITATGSQATVGTAVTVVLTLSVTSAGAVAWTCSTCGNTSIHKNVPAECRQ